MMRLFSSGRLPDVFGWHRRANTPPEPWRHVAFHAVGGLIYVGFAEASDTLLVISHDESALLDCLTGEWIERDGHPYIYDDGSLSACGIGPLAGTRIDIAGMAGGVLADRSADEWKIAGRPKGKGQDMLDIFRPGESRPAARLSGFASALRAFGFSPTGKTLAIATHSDVSVYGRP